MKIAFRWVLVGVMALSAACGGAPEANTAASQARGAGLVVALHVDNDTGGLRESLTEALARAGYSVVAPRKDRKNVDLVANAHVTTSDTRKVGPLTLKGVNDVHVRLVLERPDGVYLGVVEEDFSGSSLTESDLAGMARAVAESRATALSLAERRQRISAAAAEKKRADEENQLRIEAALEARKQEQQRLSKVEDEAWTSSRDSCTTAVKSTSCDALAKFAWTYSKSAHAAEAETLVAKSRARMIELKDDEAWAEAAPHKCTAPQDENACDGVTGYVMANPDGKRVAEAAKLIKAAEPTCAKLRREREAKEARATAATESEVATNYGSGSSYGGGSSRGSRRGGGGGTIHVREYTRKDGTHVSGHSRRRR